MGAAVLYCPVKIHAFARCEVGTLNKKKLFTALYKAFFKGGNIIHHAVGKGLFVKTAACKSVSAPETYERIESRSFKTGGIQHGQVKAGAKLLTDNYMRHPYPLSQILIACRRIAVGYIERL